MTSDTFEISLKYDRSATVNCKVDEQALIGKVVDGTDLPADMQKPLRQCSSVAILRSKIEEIGDDLGDVGNDEHARRTLAALEAELKRILGNDTLWQRVVRVLRQRLPTFFYFSDYSILPGRLDLQDLVPDGTDKPASTGLQTARALLELAGTDVKSPSDENYEIRKAELEAVSNG